ncbi:type II toxin-antitoxin system HipA family toxin [Streptomyces sp. NPDC059743]|uniref:type II toxin-antitoxin system HipA family toxin n=1 Tax=Streptomyces sp. NPDC059743 TaxID=3346928 RepID=UPI00364744FE
MALPETFYAVLLHGRRIGTLCQKGDYTQFLFNESYLDDPRRPVLGLRFEEALRRPYASALRLPKWFSNLLPEGPLRTWIAEDRDVPTDREMELLAQVGHDLPGAVQVLPAEGPDENWDWPGTGAGSSEGGKRRGASDSSPWRFSLAGVALKFSMLAKGDRLTVPAAGEHGDWLVKFPDYRFPNVPHNEFAMMSLARKVGIDVPEVRLLHRDELAEVPSRMWPNAEKWAYAVRRFDRIQDEQRSSVHIEDFAQVREKYPHEKYQGSFETVAAISYRGRDGAALQECVRRLALFIAIGNGDAHLKNWSLIYPDKRVPTLSPAYDLVSTAQYRELGDGPEDLGLKFCGTKRFEKIGVASFSLLESRLDHRFGSTASSLPEIAAETVHRIAEEWPGCREDLAAANPSLAKGVTEWIEVHLGSLLSGSS